jgi:predicted PurR-regulated permease PerM
MKKILFLAICLISFLLFPFYVFAQNTTTDQQTEEMLKNYLQNKQSTNQNTNQTGQTAQQTSENSTSQRNSTSSLSLFVVILYATTFLLIWFFLIMWIYTLFRWARQKNKIPVEIGRKMN